MSTISRRPLSTRKSPSRGLKKRASRSGVTTTGGFPTVVSEGEPAPMLAKISQETLAEMVGTTRSRVSMFMNKFRKLGFIEYNGSLEVHNSLLNVVLHDNPHLRNRAEKEK